MKDTVMPARFVGEGIRTRREPRSVRKADETTSEARREARSAGKIPYAPPTKRVGECLLVFLVRGFEQGGSREAAEAKCSGGAFCADEATSEAMAKRCKHRKNPLC